MAAGTLTPEQKARVRIDAGLLASGWIVQDNGSKNILAGTGVAVREFPLTTGFADYLLFVNGQAVGALEAKPEGHTLAGVEPQADKYAHGLPSKLVAPVKPLPFLYISTGAKTRFINGLDLKPRTRDVFQIHRPDTLAEWLKADTLDQWVKALHIDGSGLYTAAQATKPSSLRSRIATLPNVEAGRLYPNQVEAIVGLEKSFKQDKPRALIQMATGSGKTIMAVTALYRLIKFGGARRVLFLVDRQNLAEQAEREFQGYRTPDDNRKFTDLYKVQRLTTNTISTSTKVVITTVQRLYSMLKGEPDLPPEEEDGSAFDREELLPKEPLPVVYNAAISPEYFDVIVIDECHRSIYSLWRQVIEYFDAYLVGLTATPAKHTYGFFNQNLVMEYPHERAVADRVNVDFEVYKIRTKITEQGATIEKDNSVDVRDRGTTRQRWLKDDVTYAAKDLDRTVVAMGQIRLIAQTYRDRLPTELFPGRKEVPKTLVFAKDDQHAEDLVEILRQEFGEGNAFCQKITYKTTGAKTADLIQAFRNEFNPRIAVTVDMIATGTDIRPIEVVIFLREVKSRVLFEQMKGRGVRIIDANELRSVTPSASAKTHFLVIDCVGVTEGDLPDTQPLERKKTTPFKALLEHVASGGTDPDVLSSLASRLARLDKVLLPAESKKVQEAAGVSLGSITAKLVAALDPDEHVTKAREIHGLPADAEPTLAQTAAAAAVLMKEAVLPLVTLPELRKLLVEIKVSHEQIIDHVSQDELLHDKTGFSKEAKEKAMQTAIAFETWLKDSKDEIDALQFFFSVPHREQLRFKDIKALAEAIHTPPRSWTPEALWRAYETLDQKKVKGAGGQRMLTDVVSLIRFALHQDGELVPYAERVRGRFENWLAQQENGGRRFTEQQVRWLEMMRDHIAGSAEIDVDDFDATPFVQAGGLWRARELFGADLQVVLRDLNEAVAA